MDHQEKIKRFIKEKTGHSITNEDENLIERGIIDSFTMMELIAFLEQECRVPFDMENITRENFYSLRTITEAASQRQRT